jgi:hypothetical protein
MARKPPLASLHRMDGSWTTLPGPTKDCHVFFIQRANRGRTRAVMYAKIASTEFEGVNAFVAWAIKGMAKTHGKPKEKIASGKTRDGHDYFINEYPATKTYSQWERVAYIQLPHAVAYIVLSSRDEASYRKDSLALQEVLKSFIYLEPKTGTKAH